MGATIGETIPSISRTLKSIGIIGVSLKPAYKLLTSCLESVARNVGARNNLMKNFVFIFVLMVLHGLSAAASFNCENNDLSDLEKKVCENQILSSLDEQLALAYKKAIRLSWRQDELRMSQRKWVTDIRSACDDEACLESAYRLRIAKLDEGEQLEVGSREVSTPMRDRTDQDSAQPIESAQERTAPAQQKEPIDSVENSSGKQGAAKTAGGSNDDYLGYVLMIWGGIVVLGVILGWNEKIVVFRNYNDLAIVFASGICIYGAFLVAFGFASNSNSMATLSISLVVLSIGLVCYLIIRTFLDNRSILGTLLALVTKLTLSILFLFNLLSLLSPSGKTQAQRAKGRASALVWLIVITPVIHRLVREPAGIFCPKNVFNRFQRGRIGLS